MKPHKLPQWVVTIDGPAASGKSSVSRRLAEKLGWSWLSTGAFYRGLAFIAQNNQTPLNSEEELAVLSKDPSLEIRPSREITRCFFKGQDITNQIYTEDIGSLASQISVFPKVREHLLAAQRGCLIEGDGLIAEGRDCGTVVFPQALIKFFLTAESSQRALRRVKEKGGDIETTLNAQIARDTKDSHRTSAPLRVPEDAHVINTSTMDLEEVINLVHQHVLNSLKNA